VSAVVLSLVPHCYFCKYFLHVKLYLASREPNLVNVFHASSTSSSFMYSCSSLSYSLSLLKFVAINGIIDSPGR
jgi:hypothetical protein